MKNYLNSFFTRYDFPADAAEQLLSAYDVLEKNDDFMAVLKLFYDVDELNVTDIERAMDKVSADTGVHKYTVKYLYYVCLTKELPKLYAKKGISEDIMWDSLEDFRYKLDECLECYGIAGFHSTTWFYAFLRATLFKLGRMEYHIVPYKGDTVQLGGMTLKEGDRVINIHIPSAKDSFGKEARLASYRRAYRFFKDVIGTEVKVFFCHSWLLYSKNLEILPATSNVVSFIGDFKIVKDEEYKDPRSNMWRIFGKYAEGPVEELPRDNSMRRAYADFLASGQYPGCAKGVFVWDDENGVTVTE